MPTISDYNLAFRYARELARLRFPDRPAREQLEWARKRTNKPLITLARINRSRRIVQPMLPGIDADA